MEVNKSQVVADLNLDTVEDLSTYLIGYRAFMVGTARVILSISKDGEVSLTVNGVVEDAGLPPQLGAKIIFQAVRHWKTLRDEVKQRRPDLTLHCYPVVTDGKGDVRVKAFYLAGFRQEGDLLVC